MVSFQKLQEKGADPEMALHLLGGDTEKYATSPIVEPLQPLHPAMYFAFVFTVENAFL
jgi:hypothetical protein